MRARAVMLLWVASCGPAEPANAPAPASAPASATATATAPAPASASASASATASASASATASASASASAPVSAPVPAPIPAPAPAAPRLYAIEGFPWIYPTPEKKGERYLGYIRVGESVALRKPEPVPGVGCGRGFWAVEPRGYICDGPLVSRDPPPELRPGFQATLATKGPFPYKYAISNGTPMYNRIPTRAEQSRYERFLGAPGTFEPLSKFLAAHEDLALNEPIAPTDPLPDFLSGGKMARSNRFDLVRQNIPHGSMLSYTKAFLADGRTYLLSVDMTVVPADRVRAFKPSAFHGVRLDADVQLPLAWFRKNPKQKWRKRGSVMEASGTSFAARTYAGLTGQNAEVDGVRYLETKEREGGEQVWVRAEDATVVEAREKLPFGVPEGLKWVHVRITQGTLTAYEGLRPVYSTLVSPGSGGVPVKGIDNVKASTTPTGTYRVTFKDRATTMSPDKGENRTFWIADVPHTQYFNPPFALHAAYWHERFGEPTSAGCVNLSPIDAEAIFQWSDPPVPQDWQGASGAGAPENGPTTAVVVSR